MHSTGLIATECHARLGFIGNPSDGFFGKTIAVMVHNWAARVLLWESPELVIESHPQHDAHSFAGLDELYATAAREGYYGGVRLVYATCKRFYEECLERGLMLPRANFTVRYDTDIPRGVGLAGSSAIVTATLRALMEFYDITEEELGKPLLPNLVRNVETKELGLTAGLQDRVIQVYGGAVYMDFDRERMERDGHGLYVPMDLDRFPPLYIAMVRDPSDSSGIHSPVRVRWERGDEEVIAAMAQFAHYAEQCREALERGDLEAVHGLMDANFDLRRRLYGDDALGPANLRMIELARSTGASAKFSGSGGAIIGMYDDDRHFDQLSALLAGHGFSVYKARLHPD
jgi:glucuronokinase